MEKVLLITLSTIFLTAFTGYQIAFAADPPPTIEFAKIDDNGCKVFNIKDIDGEKSPGIISKIFVDERGVGDLDKVTSDGPVVVKEDGPAQWEFDYDSKKIGNARNKMTITVCPEAKDTQVVFEIIVLEHPDDKNRKTSRLVVIEDKIKKGSDDFDHPIEIPKSFAKIDCKQVKKDTMTNNANAQVDCKAKDPNKPEEGTIVNIKGSLTNERMPGLVTSIVDPPEEFFFIQLDVCLPGQDDELICPTDLQVNHLVIFPSSLVGGELIPIESASLLLAGAQSFSWMIPVLVSGIGIGLFVVSRKSENSSIKQIQ